MWKIARCETFYYVYFEGSNLEKFANPEHIGAARGLAVYILKILKTTFGRHWRQSVGKRFTQSYEPETLDDSSLCHS